MAELLDIGEVRSRTGLTASALQFYERKGLIESVARRGLRRQYLPEVIDRVAVIVVGQRAGFSLAEIQALLDTGGDRVWKDLAVTKLFEVRDRIDALRDVEQGLEHALQCPSDNVFRCEHFRAELAAVLPVDRSSRGPGSGPP